MNTERVSCILCNVDDTDLFCRKESLTYVRCKRCGLVYVNPRLTGESLKKVYTGSLLRTWWKKFFYARRDVTSFKNLNSRLARAEKLMHEVERYTSAGRILDIGCNRGFLLATAVSGGWDAYGIEIVTWFPQVVARRFPMKIYTEPLRDISPPFADNFFDAVTMIDIIEHLANPLEDLREVKRILKPDGFLLVNTPDIGSAYAVILGSEWGSVNPQEHYYLFDRKTFGKLAREAGFSIVAFQPSKGSTGEMEVHLRPIPE